MPNRIIHCFLVVAIISSLLFSPTIFIPISANLKIEPTDIISTNNSLPNFDIRFTQKKHHKVVDTTIEKHRVNTLVIEANSKNSIALQWNEVMDLPHSIFSYEFPLTSKSTDDISTISKHFILNNRKFFKINSKQLDTARIATFNKDSQSGFTKLILEQQIQGIRVIDTEMMFIVDKNGQLLLQSGSFIPESENLNVRNNKQLLSLETALNRAAETCGKKLTAPLNSVQSSTNTRTNFSSKEVDSRSQVSLVYFPINQQEIKLAYEVLLYGIPRAIDAYRLVVDAISGELLSRTYLTQSFAALAGRVFTKENPIVAGDRELVPLSGTPELSKLGWINNNKLEGNNTQVIFDPKMKGTEKKGIIFETNTTGNFNFPLDLNKSPTEFPQASATNLFYWVNLAHDKFYELGFDESSRNFQVDNLDKPGIGKDPIIALNLYGSAIDPSTTDAIVRNNAYFSPTPEGISPFLAMLVWEKDINGQKVELDSAYDASIILHEYTHGVSTRLVSTDISMGLTSFQSYGLSEGWSDFFAISFLNDEQKSLDAPISVGTYLTDSARGIRSFPYSISFDLNPLTFGDIRYNYEPHLQGTVWCTILWELRQSLIKQYGFSKGREIAEKLVLNGLKLTPLAPSFIDARNAILAADKVTNDGINQSLLWEIFAKRGMGSSASTRDFHTGEAVEGFLLKVTEGFDIPVGFSSGSIVINEKIPNLAVIDEPLPLVVLDKDLMDLQSVNIKIKNERTNEENILILKRDEPGRFIGDLKITQDLTQNELTNKPGDKLLITYQDPVNETTAKTDAIVGQRIKIYKQDFENDQNDLIFRENTALWNGKLIPNLWHISERHSVSSSHSLCFSREEAKKSIAPYNQGIASLNLNIGNLLKPHLEFEFFSDAIGQGILGFATDNLILECKTENPSLDVIYFLNPQLEKKFKNISIDLRLLENQQIKSLDFNYEEGAGIIRNQIEGAYIDDVYITAVSTK